VGGLPTQAAEGDHASPSEGDVNKHKKAKIAQEGWVALNGRRCGGTRWGGNIEREEVEWGEGRGGVVPERGRSEVRSMGKMWGEWEAEGLDGAGVRTTRRVGVDKGEGEGG